MATVRVRKFPGCALNAGDLAKLSELFGSDWPAAQDWILSSWTATMVDSMPCVRRAGINNQRDASA